MCSLPTRNKTVAKKSNTSVPTLACEENISHLESRKIIFFCPCNVYTWSFNDTDKEKLCFTQFIARMAAWLLLSFIIRLHNQLSKFYTFYYHILKSADVWKSWFFPVSFTAKFALVFVLTLEKTFSWRFQCKASRESIGFSKKRY